jgi:hypothetical protein
MDERYAAAEVLQGAYAQNIPLAESETVARFLTHKIRHSFDVAYVACEMMVLDPALSGLSPRERDLVEIAALLHDLGRFYQHDGKVILWEMDHGREGASRLAGLKKCDDPAILFAIDEHDAYQIDMSNLPAKGGPFALIAAKVVRDADKLANILDFSMHGVKEEFLQNKAGALSGKVREALASAGQIMRRDSTTYADDVVNCMCWYDDMNFAYTKDRVRSLRYFEQSVALLERLGVSKSDLDLVGKRFRYG